MSSKRVDDSVVAKAEQRIRQEFFAVDSTISQLKYFVAMNETMPRTGNLILYGPGGYGKSEMSALFLQEITGQRPFIVNMSQSTTTTEIWGGLDMVKFSQGDWEYQIAKSFMEHEYVIFEEGLEPRSKVLSALKHVLTSGIFEVAGVTPTPIKTKGIIIVTNVDTELFNDNDENRAFMERFPLRQRVSWDNLNAAQRRDATLHVIQKFDTNNMVPKVFSERIAERATAQRMSPRIVGRIVHAMTSYEQMFNSSNKKVSEQTFAMIAQTFGIAQEAEITEEILQVKVEENVKVARASMESIFNKLGQRVEYLENLYDHYNDPQYVARITGHISTMNVTLDRLSYAVADIRTQPEYGDLGAELSSWANEQLAELQERMERVKDNTYPGLLLTVTRMSEDIRRLTSLVDALQEDADSE